jgi:hypothetical protein
MQQTALGALESAAQGLSNGVSMSRFCYVFTEMQVASSQLSGPAECKRLGVAWCSPGGLTRGDPEHCNGAKKSNFQ